MALFIRQTDQRSELQERIATELREKLKNEPQLEYEKPANNIVDSSHESQHLGPVVILVVAVVLLGVAYLVSAR
jgi:hypothetical protein